MKGIDVIKLIEQTCDTDCELLIEVQMDGKRKFFKIVRTDEVFLPKGSQYAATLVGYPTEKGETLG